MCRGGQAACRRFRAQKFIVSKHLFLRGFVTHIDDLCGRGVAGWKVQPGRSASRSGLATALHWTGPVPGQPLTRLVWVLSHFRRVVFTTLSPPPGLCPALVLCGYYSMVTFTADGSAVPGVCPARTLTASLLPASSAWGLRAAARGACGGSAPPSSGALSFVLFRLLLCLGQRPCTSPSSWPLLSLGVFLSSVFETWPA